MQTRLASMKARHVVVALATAGWLAVSGAVSPAPAAPIGGDFSLSGTDNFDFASNTINILSNSISVVHGSFPGSLVGTSLTFPANPINYSTLTGLLFTGNSGLSFTIAGLATFIETDNPPGQNDELEIAANGTLTLTGFD